MLVPGVLSGSKGPLLYPAEEVRKSPDDWNHIPIVVYHPMKDGKPVSARSPSILSKYGVGFVFHSRADSKGVLKGEGWLDVEATRRVDRSVLDSVQLGKPIELSTGLFVDDEPAPEGAIFNDHRGTRKYVGIARNYKPDHLAILPSGKGACSLADGCGVLINEATMEAYQVIVNELEAEGLSLYFPDLELDLLTANKFNPNQPRDKSGRFATVAAATKKVEKAQGRVAKAQAALDKAKATLKVEKSGLLVAKKGLSEAKAREKAKSPAATRAIGKAKASTGTVSKGGATKADTAAGSKSTAAAKSAASTAAKADSTPDFHTLAHTTHEANRRLTHPTTGLPPVIPRLYEEVASIHPGLKEKDFHEHLRELQKRDIATQQVWDTSVKMTKQNTGGYTADRFPLGGRSGVFPIGWVAFRPDATSRINADAGRTKATAGTASPRSTPTAPKPAASPRAGKSGNSTKSIDEHHAETEALTQRGMAGEEHIGRRGFKEFRPTESHEDFSKAVDSHIAGLNKSLNKAQVIELGLKLGMSHHESATKKSVLDKIRTDIHARRGARDRPAATGGTVGHTTPTSKPAASPRAGKSGKSVSDHIQKTQSLLAQSLNVDKATVKAHVDQMAKDLNKAQVLEVAKSIGLGGKQKTKKDALKIIHDTITRQKGVYTRGLE
jgi:hypothetical protein